MSMTKEMLYDVRNYDSNEIVDPKAELFFGTKDNIDSIISKYSNDKDVVVVSPKEEYLDVLKTALSINETKESVSIDTLW